MFLIRATWAFACRMGLLLSLVLCGGSLAVVGVNFPIPALFAAAVVRWRCRRSPPSDSHGSARLTTASELLKAGYITGDDGLIVGKVGPSPHPSRAEGVRMLCNPAIGSTVAMQGCLAAFSHRRSLSERFIRVRGVTHLSTIAPTGKGKGVSCLIPNLMAYQGSCVVFDPKYGELFKATAEHRRRKLGHDIIRIDPFGVCGRGSHTYNPLDFMPAGDPALPERARDTANQLIVRLGTEPDPYWNDKAEHTAASLLYFIARYERRPHERNLESLCDIVSSREKFARAIRFMQTYDDNNPTLQRLGETLAWLRDRELNSVMSSLLRHVQWMQSPLVLDSLRTSSFDPRVLRERPATLYLVLPAEFLTVMQPLIRLWIGSTLRVLTRRGADESNPVLYLIDEAFQVGQMRALEDAVTLYRGMGIKCWFFWQAQDQLKACFGDRANIIQSNMDVTQYFGLSDYTTAEAVTKRIGEATIHVESGNWTTGYSRPTGPSGPHPQPGSVSQSSGGGMNAMARHVFKTEEVLTLPDSVSLIFIKNHPVIAGWLVRWYADPAFRRGGTGKQRGLGLAAGVMAMFMLLASIMAAGFASKLPLPGTPEWAASSARWEAARLNVIQRQRQWRGWPPPPSYGPYNGLETYPPSYGRTVPSPWPPQRRWPQPSPYGF